MLPDTCLVRLDLAEGRAVLYRHDPTDPHSLSHDRVTAIFEDTDKTVWVGTYSGLNRFVDDEPVNRRVLLHQLSNGGYHTVGAASGEELRHVPADSRAICVAGAAGDLSHGPGPDVGPPERTRRGR